jgi:hypothetical protein
MKAILSALRKVSLVAIIAFNLSSLSAQAAFHLWNIREVYTDSTGTKQFIELFCPASGQTFLSGQSLTVSAGGTNHTITISSNTPETLNHAFLIATSAAQTSGAPAANCTIPTNFLFLNGASISFFGANSGAYTNLPTDGTLSRTWNSGNAVNSPQNFAGSVGQVTNPAFAPTISITNPANNKLFAAPATVSVGVSASDSDGTVSEVRLLTNGVAAATNTVSPFGFTLSNLAAGNYALTARAQDNSALATTSSAVTIRVATQPTLSVVPAVSGFSYNTRTGVNYVVERSLTLSNFSSVVTNAGSGGTLQFQETNTSPTQRTYRVRLE